MMVLFGAQHIWFNEPLQANREYKVHESIGDIRDKKKAFILVPNTKIVDKETGKTAVHIESELFCREPGNFGHKGKTPVQFPKRPQREPDHTSVQKTMPN